MAGSISATSLAGVAAAAGVASAGMGAMGAIQAGQAKSAAASYNADIANKNATIATQNANWASQSGAVQADQQSMKTRAQVGAIKGAQAANNVDVNSGSNLDVQSSAQQLGELSALTIKSNAAKEAYGYQTQSWSDTAQANLDQADAAASSEAGYVGGATSLIGGVASAGSGWANYQALGGMNTTPKTS